MLYILYLELLCLWSNLVLYLLIFFTKLRNHGVQELLFRKNIDKIIKYISVIFIKVTIRVHTNYVLL